MSTPLLCSSVLVWITVLVQNSRELHPLHSDCKRRRWISTLAFSSNLSEPCPVFCILNKFSYPALCKWNFIFPQTQGLLFLIECATDSFTAHELWGKCIHQGAAPQAEQNQSAHSPGCHQANETISDESMGHSNYCQRPRSHSAYNNTVWKTIETRVQVIKTPEDERISCRFQSTGLYLNQF